MCDAIVGKLLGRVSQRKKFSAYKQFANKRRFPGVPQKHLRNKFDWHIGGIKCAVIGANTYKRHRQFHRFPMRTWNPPSNHKSSTWKRAIFSADLLPPRERISSPWKITAQTISLSISAVCGSLLLPLPVSTNDTKSFISGRRTQSKSLRHKSFYFREETPRGRKSLFNERQNRNEKMMKINFFLFTSIQRLTITCVIRKGICFLIWVWLLKFLGSHRWLFIFASQYVSLYFEINWWMSLPFNDYLRSSLKALCTDCSCVHSVISEL